MGVHDAHSPAAGLQTELRSSVHLSKPPTFSQFDLCDRQSCLSCVSTAFGDKAVIAQRSALLRGLHGAGARAAVARQAVGRCGVVGIPGEHSLMLVLGVMVMLRGSVSYQLHEKFEHLKRIHQEEKRKVEEKRRELEEEMNAFNRRKVAVETLQSQSLQATSQQPLKKDKDKKR